MILSPKSFIGPLQNIMLDGHEISLVSKASCLGLTIDNKLTWKEHVTRITKSFAIKIKKLYTMRDLSTNALNTIYLQGILPSVTYGISIWGNCSMMNQLNELHLRAACFIHKIPKHTLSSTILDKSKWKSLDWTYKYRIACLTFKLYKNDIPESLLVWKSKQKNQRTLRNNHRVEIQEFNKISYKRSFAYRSSLIWNQLSNDSTDKDSIISFKHQVKNEVEMLSFDNAGMKCKKDTFTHFV